MVNIELAYQGQLRCQAVHVPSGTQITTDAPVDNHGKGESFSPTDLVATALGCCMFTIMGILAERHEIDLAGATASVTKEMTAEGVRRISRLTVTFSLPASVSAEHRTMLETGARGCPVLKSISPEIDLDVQFRWV